MSIVYKVTKSEDGFLWLDLTPSLVEDQIRFAKENGISNFSCIWHPTDNIEDFPSFDGIDVVSLFIGNFGNIKNIGTINKLGHLRFLKMHFQSPPSTLDFSNLSRLEELEMTYNNKVEGLSKLVNLRELNLWKYKPFNKDLREFKDYVKIEKLMLIQPVINSLDGIQALNHLEELEVSRPKGFDIFFRLPIKNNLFALKSLTLSFCKELNFESIPIIENLACLRIMDCGKLSTLKEVLKNLPNLSKLIFTRTELINGSLDYLLDHPTLDKVTIDHKKHYNMKEKEINALLAEKRSKK